MVVSKGGCAGAKLQRSYALNGLTELIAYAEHPKNIDLSENRRKFIIVEWPEGKPLLIEKELKINIS